MRQNQSYNSPEIKSGSLRLATLGMVLVEAAIATAVFGVFVSNCPDRLSDRQPTTRSVAATAQAHPPQAVSLRFPAMME